MVSSLFDGLAVAKGNLTDLVEVSSGGIVSKPLLDSGPIKQILFALDSGQSLSEHRAPFLATIHILEGSVQFTVEQQEYELTANDWLIMPPDAVHSVLARQPSRLLLTLLKQTE